MNVTASRAERHHVASPPRSMVQQTTMSTAAAIQTRPWNRRWYAGLGALLFFGVLFALPLCAALALCTMPCCHRAADPAAALVSGDMAGCEEQCAIRADEATKPAAATIVRDTGSPRLAYVAAAVLPGGAAPGAIVRADDGRAVPHRSADAPLHVLNSVFRI